MSIEHSPISQVDLVHSTYERVTGLTIKLAIHERAIVDFLKTFSVDDFRCVLEYIRRFNHLHPGCEMSWRFNKLLDFEYCHFDSLLSEARATERNLPKPKTPRETAVCQFRAGIEPEVFVERTRSIADVFKQVILNQEKGI